MCPWDTRINAVRKPHQIGDWRDDLVKTRARTSSRSRPELFLEKKGVQINGHRSGHGGVIGMPQEVLAGDVHTGNHFLICNRAQVRQTGNTAGGLLPL